MPQAARPTSTVSSSNATAVGAATLHEATDEVVRNDADYAHLIAPGLGSANAELMLSAVNDPGVHTGHVIHAVIANVTTHVVTHGIELKQGSTVIKSWDPETITNGQGFTEYTVELSEAEAANITNYSDLRIRPSYTSGGSGEYKYSQLFLEVPDVPVTLSIKGVFDPDLVPKAWW